MADEFWEANFGIIPQSVNDSDVWRAILQVEQGGSFMPGSCR
jgi:hypothetical protein